MSTLLRSLQKWLQQKPRNRTAIHGIPAKFSLEKTFFFCLMKQKSTAPHIIVAENSLPIVAKDMDRIILFNPKKKHLSSLLEDTYEALKDQGSLYILCPTLWAKNDSREALQADIFSRIRAIIAAEYYHSNLTKAGFFFHEKDTYPKGFFGDFVILVAKKNPQVIMPPKTPVAFNPKWAAT